MQTIVFSFYVFSPVAGNQIVRELQLGGKYEETEESYVKTNILRKLNSSKMGVLPTQKTWVM